MRKITSKFSIQEKILRLLEESNILDLDLKMALSKSSKESLLSNLSRQIKKLLLKLRSKKLTLEDRILLESSISDFRRQKIDLLKYSNLNDLILHKFTLKYDVEGFLDHHLTNLTISSEGQNFTDKFMLENVLSEKAKSIKRARVLRPFLRSKNLSDELKRELRAFIDSNKVV